jgi:diacylglycerol O-acyltransferase
VQQLTGLDAAFLALEEMPGVYGHVGSLIVLDPSTSTVPYDLDHLLELIGSRLHLIPPFRRRLVEVPFGLDQPYWIEDPDFDLEYHVREIALPPPGDHEQLATQAARLHARRLDRRRPLWELYLIHGLEDGHVGVYTKVHHAAIDGVSGNDLLAAVLDPTPEGRDVGTPPPHVGEQEASALRMLVHSAWTLTLNPLRAARLAYGLVRSLPEFATSPIRPHLPVVDRLLGRDEHVVLTSPSFRAPMTPFNRDIGPHRRWAFGDLPLDDVKAVKNAAGATVNDVVMAICAGGLRRWLAEHGALPPDPLIAAVPVSVRSDDEQGEMGNRVSAMFAPLPTHVADPVERLHACSLAMGAAKDQHEALPADLLGDVTRFAAPALAGQAARLVARLRVMERVNPFNLIISNVPGPRVPLYYGGARMVAYYPLSAIAEGQGLNLTVMSYLDTVHYGFTADRELVPDVDVLGHHVEDELQLLREALGV